MNGSFNTSRESTIGVPQDSVLGPLAFYMYLHDLFIFVKGAQICSYGDDTTICASDSNYGVSDRKANTVVRCLKLSSVE